MQNMFMYCGGLRSVDGDDDWALIDLSLTLLLFFFLKLFIFRL